MIFYNTKQKQWLVGFLSLCTTSVLWATKPKELPPSKSSLVTERGGLVFQFGGYWGTAGKSQHININGAIGDQYNASGRHASNALLGLGYYTKYHYFHDHALQYGVNAFYLNDMTVNGTINQENLFTNLSYYYDLKHLPVYAMFKMPQVFKLPSHFAVAADVGIGPNIMFLSRVNEQSLDGGVTLPDNAFGSRTDVTFSATAGFNIHFLQPALRSISCGYRFFYLGDAKFKRNTSQLQNTLTTGTSYANALMCQMMI